MTVGSAAPSKTGVLSVTVKTPFFSAQFAAKGIIFEAPTAFKFWASVFNISEDKSIRKYFFNSIVLKMNAFQ